MYKFNHTTPIFIGSARPTPFSKWCIVRICICIPLLVLFCYLFYLCNKIPTTYCELDVDSYGLTHEELGVHLSLGGDSSFDEKMDSLLNHSFSNSGRLGVITTVTADSSRGFRGWWRPYERMNVLRAALPEDPRVDSVNALVTTNWKVTSISGSAVLFTQSQGYTDLVEPYKRESKALFIPEPKTDSTYYAIRSTNYGESRDSYIGSQDLFFRAPAKKYMGANNFRRHWSPLFYNYKLTKLSDISQANIGLVLTYRSNGKQTINPWEGTFLEENPFTLSIDFGTPISASKMNPEPDYYTVSGMSFSSPEKIRRILEKGLVFHVKYIGNENMQSMKLFFLTTIIAALATWLFSTLFKWAVYRIRKRKRIKQIKKEADVD